MKGFKRRRKALEKRKDVGRKGRKGVRACARDAQILTPRAGGRVEALRARGTTPGGMGARQERETQERRERENRRWASDEWGCRAVATNRQNQG
jgi:hypothetical protein